MPKITVEITWDYPDEPFWLNADNIKIALDSYCTNTAFSVVEVKPRIAQAIEAMPFADEIVSAIEEI